MKKYRKIKNRIKSNKGITLIALVVTIVVLLILAGITISTLTGENGIITQASDAKKRTEIEGIEEQIEMAVIKAEQKYKKPTLDNIIEEIKNNGVISDASQVNRETGAVTSDLGYVIEGKLDDYTEILAKNVLKIDSTATETAAKSPYVIYNELDCRALYNDDTYGIQIITSESVEEVTLGSGDTMVTASDFTYEGTATVDDNFLRAAASYNNLVDNLNNRAKLYMDTKGIAKDARCLGSLPTLTNDSMFKCDTSGMYSGEEEFLSTYGWNGKFKTLNYNEREDADQINRLGLCASTRNTWSTSRWTYMSGSALSMTVCPILDDGGTYNLFEICRVYSDGTCSSKSQSFGFRPVFLLPSDTVIRSGDGSSENPYIIE